MTSRPRKTSLRAKPDPQSPLKKARGRPEAQPRLDLLARPGRASVYVIYHGSKQISTRTGDKEKARRIFADYLIGAPSAPVPERTLIADIIDTYGPKCTSNSISPERREQLATIDRDLRAYWGKKTLAEVTPASCKAYWAARGLKSGSANHEFGRLKRLLFAFCKKENLSFRPSILLPPKSDANTRFLTPAEIDRLIWACRGRWWNDRTQDWKRHRDGTLSLTSDKERARTQPLERLIWLGVYTGSRRSVYLDARWHFAAKFPHIDLVDKIFYRSCPEEDQNENKKRPPAPLCPELLKHVLSWAAADRVLDCDRSDYGRHFVLHDQAGQGYDEQVLDKLFHKVVRAAGLGSDVTIRVFRHTAATWLLALGATMESTAKFLGITVHRLEHTYAQVEPGFTREAADALAEWGRPDGRAAPTGQGFFTVDGHPKTPAPETSQKQTALPSRRSRGRA